MNNQLTRCFIPLESLRGVAALAVVIFHAVWTNPITDLRLFQNGPLMVDFFFVLSGFVICHSYGARLTDRTEITRFLWLRLGRVYPLHFVMLFVFVGFEFAKLLAERHFGIVADKPAFTVNNGFALTTNLLLLQSLGLHHSLTYNYPSWSISTEFYAYVFFAFVRHWIGDGRRYIAAAAAIVVASFGILPAVGVHSLSEAGYDWGFFRCCGGFFLGTLVCHIYAATRPGSARATESGWKSALAPVSLLAAVAFLASIDPEGKQTYLFPWLAALIVLSIVCWPERVIDRILGLRPLRYLGKISYSIYMVHAAVVWIVAQFLTVIFKFPKLETLDGHIVQTPALFGSALLIGYVLVVVFVSGLTYRFIEEPCRRRSREVAQELGGIELEPATSAPSKQLEG